MVRLKDLRIKYGMSQADLADLLGVAPGAVSKWENEMNQMDYNTFKIKKPGFPPA